MAMHDPRRIRVLPILLWNLLMRCVSCYFLPHYSPWLEGRPVMNSHGIITKNVSSKTAQADFFPPADLPGSTSAQNYQRWILWEGGEKMVGETMNSLHGFSCLNRFDNPARAAIEQRSCLDLLWYHMHIMGRISGSHQASIKLVEGTLVRFSWKNVLIDRLQLASWVL